jgi:hypothetical protein
MKFSHAAIACLAAALFATGASAQLKPHSGTGLSAPPAAAAASTPRAGAGTAAGSANTPDAATAANAEKERAGALAAAGWLVLLDRRDWGTAWETSSSVFRATVPLASWMDGIPKVRAPLGNLVERAQLEAVYKTTLQGRPDGEYVSVIFDSKFANKQVQEVVTTVRDTDGRWRVTGYAPR